ncbi:MAG TPA: diaminopimelate epimerase [Jiangellaceae bacterium]
MTSGIPFVKGHGTENDFVLLPDPDNTLASRLDDAAVQRLADRHSGIGADGVIRVVPTASDDEVAALADQAEWFMDYRNADGSRAEMCGNGIRVMARYLWESGRAEGQALAIATRGGVRTVHAGSGGAITVEMGHAKPSKARQLAFVAAAGHTWPAVAVSVPNPHAVVFVDDLEEPGRLTSAPELRPASVFPESANVEFVVGQGERHIALRVWERGVGETRSCGTGVCAAAWAAMRRDGLGPGSSYVVDVPGGRLTVTERPDGELLLTGAAEIGVHGTVDLEL